MIPLERLAAHALEELDERESAEVDEHVLGCSECAEKLERLLSMGDAVRELVTGGRVRVAVTPAMLEHLRREGLVSRTYRVARDASVACSVAKEDVYTLIELEADLAGVARVDVTKTRGVGFRDVPKDRARGVVAFVEPCEQIRKLPSGQNTLVVLAVDGDGERPLGTYVLDHTAPT